MWKLALGISILICCFAVGFIPMSEETYQHVRIWSHAIWGAAIALGVVLTVSAFVEV